MTREPTRLLGQLRRLTAAAPSDGELLDRFAARHDEDAFATLVRRHGGTVLAVCRSVLRQEQDAEDAFQATFLILAKKAGALRNSASLAGYLHRVAYRLALRLRARAVRRREWERGEPDRTAGGPMLDAAHRELQQAIHEEVSRLPEKYRAAVVLCYLQGRTQDEAARELGWTAGTVRGRLDRARQRLRSALARRGLTPSTALLAGVLAVDASAVPPELSRRVIGAARTFGSGQAVGELTAAGTWGALRGRLWVALVVLALGGAAVAAVLAPPRPAESSPVAKEAPPRPPAVRVDRYGDPLPPAALARLGTVRLRVQDSPGLLACLPGGKELLLVELKAGDGTVLTWWDLATGKLLRQRHSDVESPFVKPVLSPDARTLVLAGTLAPEIGAQRRHRLALWDLATGKERQGPSGTDRRVLGLAFAPDGKTFVTSEKDDSLRVWDAATGAELRRLPGKRGRPDKLAFSPDGRVLATAVSQRKEVYLWDVATGREGVRLVGQQAGLSVVLCFSPDGKILATAHADCRVIQLWDVASGKEIRQLHGGPGTYSLCFSPDGRTLATGAAGDDNTPPRHCAIRLWNVAGGKELRRLPGHPHGVQLLAFTPDGKRLASAGRLNVIRVWDMATGRDLVSFPEPEGFVTRVAFAPDGRSLATAGSDKIIRLWEPCTGKPARLFEEEQPPWVRHLAFTPGGRSLLARGHDGSVRFWDVAAGRVIRRLKGPGDLRGADWAASPDGSVLARWGSDRGLRLVDAVTGKELRRLPCDPIVALVHFSPDGKRLAVASLVDTVTTRVTVRLLDAATGKEIYKWPVAAALEFLAFSPDGQTLAGVRRGPLVHRPKDQRVHLWSTVTGKERTLTLAVRPAWIGAAAFSPDGRVLALGTVDGTICLVELSSGQVRGRLEGHRSTVLRLVFAPDGRTLASGSLDSTVLIWDARRRGEGRLGTLQTLWDDLASSDAVRAGRAVHALAADPGRAVPFFQLPGSIHREIDSRKDTEAVPPLGP